MLLILVSSTNGHTGSIADKIAMEYRAASQAVEVCDLADVTPELMLDASQIAVGASVRYGKFKPEVMEFFKAHELLLKAKDVALFTVCATARKDEKSTIQTNPYFLKFINKLGWAPSFGAVFGGKIDYPALRWHEKHIIRLIMMITGGPTDVSQTNDFTNWYQVEDFAGNLLHKAAWRA